LLLRPPGLGGFSVFTPTQLSLSITYSLVSPSPSLNLIAPVPTHSLVSALMSVQASTTCFTPAIFLSSSI